VSKKKVLLRGVFINRDTNGEGVLKVGTTLIRVSTVMGILYNTLGEAGFWVLFKKIGCHTNANVWVQGMEESKLR